ncbi:MAG: alkaline phosphatase family protein [Planctomycetota bacterium]
MRSRGKTKKVLIIGLDGLMMEPIERFAGQGLMPAVSGLMRRGAWSKAIPSMPVDTPTNWTTIATGADTARHGKTSFFIHLPGRELDDYSLEESWLSTHCQAETLWEAAERQGRDAIVINYPVAWPPTTRKSIIVGGRGIFGHPEMQIAGLVQWARTPGRQETEIPFAPARGWKGLPPSRKPVLEARIPIGAGGEKLGWSDAGQRRLGRREDAGTAGASHFDLAMFATTARGYDRLLFCTGKDAGAPVAALAPGAWTEWLYGRFGKDRRRGAFRCKLIRLSPDGKDFTLYRTPIVALRGFAHPDRLSAEIVRELGPFVKGLDVTYNPLYWGDRPTAREHLEMGVTQYVRLTNYLANAKPWDLLITQIQFPDHINHDYLRDIEPSFSGYDKRTAKLAWAEYRHAYRQADRYVAEILEGCADENTIITVLSDHAAFPMERNCNNLYKAFIEAGLLRYRRDRAGRYAVDWSRTKACPAPGGHYYVWINVAGRDPRGIVKPGKDYEKARDEVIEMFRGLYDRKTGRHPIAVALRREEARVLGQGGERCGDVVFFYEKGYDTDYIPPDPKVNPATMQIFGPWNRGHGAGHSPSFPTTAYAHSSLAAVFFLSGPGVRRGCRANEPIHLKDVAPTLCHLAGMEPPRHSEGLVRREFLR